MSRPLVYIIDDEEDLLFLYEAQFERSGFHVKVFADGESFLQSLAESQETLPFCVVSDFRLPDLAGPEILSQLESYENLAGFVIQTGYELHEITSQMTGVTCPVQVFEKPVNFDDVVSFVAECFGKSGVLRASG